MEAEDPLSQLRDIHLPEAVTFWPPAIGWWLLLALILIGLGFIYRQAIIAMIQRRKLANVLDELEQAYSHYNEQSAFEHKRNAAGLAFLASINVLLNRVALVMFPDAPSEKLSGSQWLEFLDSFDAGWDFTKGAGRVLADGVYQRRFDADTDALYALVKGWVEKRYQKKSQAHAQRFAQTESQS